MIEIMPMMAEDYEQAHRLWSGTPGVGLGLSDDFDSFVQFLERNPGLSRVALDGPILVGTVLAGHDGRRGTLYHLAVAEHYRHRGIGRLLANACVDDLRRAGIKKCGVVVFKQNTEARQFWESLGWNFRPDVELTQLTLEPGPHR